MSTLADLHFSFLDRQRNITLLFLRLNEIFQILFIFFVFFSSIFFLLYFFFDVVFEWCPVKLETLLSLSLIRWDWQFSFILSFANISVYAYKRVNIWFKRARARKQSHACLWMLFFLYFFYVHAIILCNCWKVFGCQNNWDCVGDVSECVCDAVQCVDMSLLCSDLVLDGRELDLSITWEFNWSVDVKQNIFRKT